MERLDGGEDRLEIPLHVRAVGMKPNSEPV